MTKKIVAKSKMKWNKISLTLLLITIICVILAIGWNVIGILFRQSGAGVTIEKEKISDKYTNEYYTIGNNPTEIAKSYFLELNDAITANDTTEIAKDVVKNFICQYYTWTNKDGNYDIGGMQYIYSPRKKDFERYTLYNFYKDMDLYITQLGRDHLIEVSEVMINSASAAEDYTVTSPTGESVTLPSVTVDASWKYKSDTGMDINSIQVHAIFRVVNNNGRMEIASITEG